MLVTARQWVNTESGERTVTLVLSALTGMLALIVLAFLIDAAL